MALDTVNMTLESMARSQLSATVSEGHGFRHLM
jgi:hypothetical protein